MDIRLRLRFAGQRKGTHGSPRRAPEPLGTRQAPKRKRGPALLPGPVSPDCCRGSGRIIGMVSAAPRPAPARACELWSGRRGWPFSTHPEGALRLPASAARFVAPAGTRVRKPFSDALSPRDPLRPSASLAQGFRLARSPGGPFLHSRQEPLAQSRPRTRVPHPFRIAHPHPVLLAHRLPLSLRNPFAWILHSHLQPALARRLRCSPSATLACRSRLSTSHSACASCYVSGRSGLRRLSESPLRLGGHVDPATFRRFASPNRSRMRFPEGTSTVSGPYKLLILLWFPAAGPSCLQS
jgi:hypothetical protein